MCHLTKKQSVLILGALAAMLLPGCTNWRYKYEKLNVDHENLKGRLQRSQQETKGLSNRISQDQQTIEELTRQIEELGRPTNQASGFGNLDTTWDKNAGTITVTLPNTILFSSGKATLKSAKSSQLDQIVSVLRNQYQGRLVDVVGHTDSDPIKKSSWKDNLELSTQRAMSVVRYMIGKGMTPSLIKASGRGSSKPVSPNSSSTNKAKNRRVEIVVYMK